MGRAIYMSENDKFWIDYFMNQAVQKGHGGFVGIPYQRGHGLGSFFGRLFRSIIPVAKSVGKTALKNIGKQAVVMGSNVISDISEGKNVKKSLERHGIRALKNVGKNTMKDVSARRQSQKKPKRKAVGQLRRGPKPKLKKKDIFD